MNHCNYCMRNNNEKYGSFAVRYGCITVRDGRLWFGTVVLRFDTTRFGNVYYLCGSCSNTYIYRHLVLF